MTAAAVFALFLAMSSPTEATLRTNDSALSALWSASAVARGANAPGPLEGLARARALWWRSGASQPWEASIEQSVAFHRSGGGSDTELAAHALTLPLHMWHYALHTGAPAKREARVARELLERLAASEDANGLLAGIEPFSGVTLGITGASAWYAGAWIMLDQYLEPDQQAAARVRYGKTVESLRSLCVDAATERYADAPGSQPSLAANLTVLYFGLAPAAQVPGLLDYLRAEAAACPAALKPLLAEAAFRSGDAALGYELLLTLAGSPAPGYLLPECVLGLYPAGAGWSRAGVSPPGVPGLPELHLTLPLPGGTIGAHHVPGVGYTIAPPTGLPVEVNAPEGVSVTVRSRDSVAPEPLSGEDRAMLESAQWDEQVGAVAGVWVSVARQRFYIIENGAAIWQGPCATAAAGAGSEKGSQKTPLGWHRVAEKFGEGAPWGQVFRSRAATREIWKPGDDVVEDMVLTRVLWLDGLEEGKNKGTRADGVLVDSKARYIYIHGTNGEAVIGTPSSHGCIRLLNDDVIEVFERLPVDTKVLITG
jgi:hypothetical protein